MPGEEAVDHGSRFGNYLQDYLLEPGQLRVPVLLKFDQGELVIGLPVGEDKGAGAHRLGGEIFLIFRGINDGAKLGKEGEKGRIGTVQGDDDSVALGANAFDAGKIRCLAGNFGIEEPAQAVDDIIGVISRPLWNFTPRRR